MLPRYALLRLADMQSLGVPVKVRDGIRVGYISPLNISFLAAGAFLSRSGRGRRSKFGAHTYQGATVVSLSSMLRKLFQILRFDKYIIGLVQDKGGNKVQTMLGKRKLDFLGSTLLDTQQTQGAIRDLFKDKARKKNISIAEE